MRSRHVTVTIHLDAIRRAAEQIRRDTGVPLIAVIKADAYGLGAVRVADALASVADDFAYFSLAEAQEVGRPGLLLGPPEGSPAQHRELKLRPAVCTPDEAERFADLAVAVNVDTGMQRFGCQPERLDDLLACCQAVEVFTHAATPQAARLLEQVAAGRGLRLHAASTSLLHCRQAWLDAVRPGLALYRGTVRVTTRLYSVRRTRGPVGYSGFRCPHVGVILAGYAHQVRPAPVLINGRRQRILEVGMNTSYVSVAPDDRAGDPVVLLGDGLTEADIATELGVREHEVLCRYCAIGRREYVSGLTRHPPAPDTTQSTAAVPRRT